MTFFELGVPSAEARVVAAEVVSRIASSQSMREAELKVRELLMRTTTREGNLLESVQKGWRQRADKIFSQLSPLLQGTPGKIFDYGMGSGAVTQRLKEELGLDIEGGDVRDFRMPHVTVPFVALQPPSPGGGIVQVPDGYYGTAILTNVIHHEEENEIILKELDRIVEHKLVIIETVPDGASPDDQKRDLERTFANDALWNRFFVHADIPVPGTFETGEDWIRRFSQYGWKCSHSENLGYDQAGLRIVHHLLVFER